MAEVTRLQAIDLCTGAGGWACAARGLPIDWVLVADHADDCLETWSLNHAAFHPTCQIVNLDLATSEGVDVVCEAAGQVDLVVGAIPCEQLSTARGNKPLKDGELEKIHELIDCCFEIVRRLKPRWWVFEDVIGVEPNLPGPLNVGIPYECRRLWSDGYGPQKRLRTFFGQFPPLADPEPGPRVLGDVLRPGPFRTLSNIKKYKRSKSKWYGGGNRSESPLMRVQEPDRPGATVMSASNGRQNERGIMVPIARVQDAGEPSPTIEVFSSRHERGALVDVNPFGRDRPLDPEEPSRTIISNDGDNSLTVQLPPTSRERPQEPDEPGRAVISYRNGDELPVRQPTNAQAWHLAADRPAPTVTDSFRCDERTVQQPQSPTRFGRESIPTANDPAHVVRTGRGRKQPVEETGLVRVLEWQEAALVQGFPVDYVFAASWSRTWKMVAQAIPVYVGRAILKGIVAAAENPTVRKTRKKKDTP